MLSRFVKRPLEALTRRLHPSRELAYLVEQAHKGIISVEEMSSNRLSRGRLRPLVAVVAAILLDLKQQRAERAALEQEIRDRIANRTDALERKIGSLQVQALRDPLTGLGNRRGLNTDLARAVEKYRLGGPDICLLMIDVDNFKPYNDSLGHPAGDQLLKEISQLTRSTLRGDDTAYRCGGDEFVVLLQGCDATAGSTIAIRLESLVRALTRSMKIAFPPQLSIGVCSLSQLPAPNAELLVQTADTRLYEVKARRPGSRRSA